MNFKKVLALVLVVAMCLSMVPTYAFAEDVELWDEEEVAAADDTALEDVYLDEEPEEVIVEDEPEATEPEAVEVEEPAAEEPAAVEEPVAAAEAAPVEETVLSVAETNDFNASAVMLNTTYKDTFEQAYNDAVDGDVITLLATPTDTKLIFINKELTIQSDDTVELKSALQLQSKTLTLKNIRTSGGIVVTGGTLSIPEGDKGVYGTVTASENVLTGDVKGGTFTEIPTALLAEGYLGDDGSATGDYLIIGKTSRGTVKAIPGLDAYEAVIETDEGTIVYFKHFYDAASAIKTDNYHGVNTKDQVINALKTYAWTIANEKVNNWINKPIKVKAEDGVTITIAVVGGAKGYFAVSETPAVGYTTYEVVPAVASYKNADSKVVYTDNFKDAATEAAKQANDKGEFEVTLYKLPTDETDVYEMGVGKLTVATGTDISISGWDKAAAEKLVTVTGEKALKVTFENNVATYKVSDAVAMVELADGTKKYFDYLYEAASYVKNGGDATKNLVITVMKDQSWPIPIGSARNWVNKPFNVKPNDGVKVSVTITNSTDTHYVVSETPATGYTTYELVLATASYVGAESKPVFTDNFKAAAEGAIAAADPTATVPPAVTLYKLPTDETDVYEMGVGKLTVATSTDVTEGWDKAAAEKLVTVTGEKVLKVEFKNNVATYTVTDAVAVVELADGTKNYYDHLYEAASFIKNGGAATKDLVINVFKDQSWNIPIGSAMNWLNKPFNVKANDGVNVSVTITNSADTHYVVSETPAVGYTTYELVLATASYVGAESKTVFTDNFKAAAEGAIAAADPTATVSPAVTLYKLPTDETDVYEMGVGKLTVATSTDVTEGWNQAAAEKLVTVTGEKVLKVEFENNVATYTVTDAVAVVELADGTKNYYDHLYEAANFVKNGGAATKDLVINVFKDQSWNIPIGSAMNWLNKPFNVKANDGVNVSVTINNENGTYYFVSETPADGYTTYELINATASYKDADDNAVFTTSFKEAAEEAEKIALDKITDGSAPTYEVTLYQIPNADTLGDVYEMANGTLTVATGTDLGEKWTKAVATSLVTAKGENKIIKVAFADNKTATYTVKGAVAKAALNDGTTEYYETVAAAVNQSMKHPNEPFYIVPIEDGVFKVTASNYGTYLGKEIRIDNSGDKKIKLAELVLDADNNEAYAYSETRNEEYGYTTYVLKKAVTSIPMTAELSKYYDPQNGGVKYFATFKEAVAADNTAVVTLIATPTDAAGATTKETYELGIPDGPTSVQVKLNGFKWLTVTPYGELALTTSTAKDTDNLVITTYSVGTAVASITTGTGASAKTTYYPTFDAAAKVGAKASGTVADKIPVIKLMADIEDVYELDYNKVMKVEIGDYKFATPVAKVPTSVTTPYIIDEATEDGVTTYTPVQAVASIGTGDDIKYYKLFADAAKDAAAEDAENPETITLYSSDSAYSLGADNNVSKLVVTVKGGSLNVTSGVDKQAVHKSGTTTVTYTLVEPEAYVGTTYYDTFANAINEKAVSATATTGIPTVVLLKDITTETVLPVGKQINVQDDHTYKIVKGADGTKPTALITTVNDTVTNYKCVDAVASVDLGTAEKADVNYYGTLGGENGAVAAAFAAEDGEPRTVVLLSTGSIAATDKYEAEAIGSVLVDMTDVAESATDAELINTIKTYVNAAKDIFVAVEKVEGKTFLVKFHSAVAQVIKNDGTPQLFATIAEAVAVSNRQHPVILLAEDQSYELVYNARDLTKNTIYVDKNGFDFTVTKAKPATLAPAVAIESEELADGITKYTAVADADEVAAYINFTEEVPDGDYGSKTVNNYVYYTSFADAVEAAENGEYVIHLTRSMVADTTDPAKDETYIMNDVEEVIRLVAGDYTALINAAEGLKLNSEPVDANPETGVEAHTVYTVSQGVATVRAIFSGSEATTRIYDNLAEAVADAIAHHADTAFNAYLTLLAKPEDDFVFGFNKLDKLFVVQDDDYFFTTSNFTAPEGGFVKQIGTDSSEGKALFKYGVEEGIASVTANENGKNVEYVYKTFAEAVAKVLEIENAKAYNDETKNLANPDTVINLWGNNPTEFAFGTDGIESLMIANNGFDPNLKASADTNFVEEVSTDLLGVTLYREAKLVATIDFNPSWADASTRDEELIVKYSSFAAAAADAFNTDYIVKIVAPFNESEFTDVFEMSIGSVKVDRNYQVLFPTIEESIKPVGENVVLSYTTDGLVGTFTVDGNEAMIVYPNDSTPRYFKTFLEAMQVQKGTELVITPLTNIKYVYTQAETIDADIKGYTVAEDVNYQVDVKVDGYETVADEDVAGKYNFVQGICYIETDEITGYDSNYKPIYRNEYYADIESAVADAKNTKTIVLIKNSSYEITSADEVVIAQLGDALHPGVDTFNVTTKIEGSDVKSTSTPAVAGVHNGVWTYTIVAKQTFKINAGEGGKFVVDGEDKEFVSNTAKAGDPINTAAFYPVEPVREGYSPDYYTDTEGNKYIWTFDPLTPEQTKAGFLTMPTTMPENGLELTAHWVANQYWVVFRDGINTDQWVKFTYDGLVKAPAPAPTKRGNAFQGWYLSTDTEHKSAFDFANTKFANTEKDTLIDHVDVPAASETGLDTEGKMILVAYFTPEDYTITFDSLVGVEIEPATVKGGYGITRPTFATGTMWQRTGYNDFNAHNGDWGYFDQNDQWVDVDFTDEATPTSVYGDMTLIPKWDPKQIVLVWADGSYVMQEDGPKDVGSAVTAPDYSSRTNTGYRIDENRAWIDEDGDIFNGKVPAKETDPLTNQWIYRLNWIKQIPVSFFFDGDVIATIDVDENSTLAENPNVPKPEDETKAYAWTLKGEDYDLTTPVTAKMTLVGTLVDVEPEEDYSDYASVVSALSLVDNINIHAYVTIKEDTDPSDYEVVITFNGNTTKEGTLDQIAKLDGSEYKIENIAVVAAPQMNDPAIVNITYKGNDVVVDEELSVRGYAEKWIEKDSVPGLKNVLIALLDYGAYSQLQFNYQTDNLVNTKYSSGNVESTSVPESYPVTVEGSVTGIGDPSIALTLVSDTTMNMYFSAAKKASFQFKIDGKEAEATYANKEYKVALPKIRVADLDVEHTFTVTRGNATMSVTAAPLAYAFQHQNDTGALGNVCKAVYLYYQAADAYFG